VSGSEVKVEEAIAPVMQGCMPFLLVMSWFVGGFVRLVARAGSWGTAARAAGAGGVSAAAHVEMCCCLVGEGW